MATLKFLFLNLTFEELSKNSYLRFQGWKMTITHVVKV